MNRSIRSLDSSYSVACEGEDHDITNLAVRRRSLYRTLYPALEDAEVETITRSVEFLPMDCFPKRCVSDHVTAKTHQLVRTEERKVPRSNSDGDAATIQKSEYVVDHRRRRYDSEDEDDHDDYDCLSKSLEDHLPAKKQVHKVVDRMSRSCSEVKKPAIRGTADAPDHRRRRRNEDEYIGFSRCNTTPATTAQAYDSDDEDITIENAEGYELVNIGVGVRMPLIGTLSATKQAIKQECLDGSSGSLVPETVLADCRRCKANLVCLFGMSCVKCQSCNTFSPVVYDKGDLVNGMVPYGLGIGLRLDKLVM